jgi:hypothetical protein
LIDNLKKTEGFGGVPPAFWFAIALAKARCVFLQQDMPMRQHIKRELALPQLWLIVAKDFLCHPSKKREDKGNILPQTDKTDTTQPLTSRLCRYKTGMDIPRQGRKGAAQAPLQ